MTRELRPRQAKTVEDLRAAYRAGHRRIVVQGCTGFGKCLGRGTPVMMFDGSIKAVQDVRPGDRLMGPDSTPRNVLTICAGREPLYRIEPVRGDPYVVNESHVLSLRITGHSDHRRNPGRGGGRHPGQIVNLEVRDYLTRSATFRHHAKGWRARVDFGPNEALRIDPYFLGVWLGDGTSRCPSICTGDLEIKAAVQEYAATLGLRIREEPNSANSVNLHLVNRVRGGPNVLTNALRSYRLLNDKHVPLPFKTASRENRLQLLAGILDADGYRVLSGYGLTLKSRRLMDDVAFVARSLGFSVTIRETTKAAGNREPGVYWRASIDGPGDQVPCRVRRKIAPPRRQKKDVLVTGIRAVTPLGEGDYFGFEIDGDRLFLLGDFTVTHNTVIAGALITNSRRKATPRRSHFWVPAVGLVDQTVRSLYAEGIEGIGVIQANHAMTDHSKPVQVVSVQTLEKREIATPPDVVFVDEVHLQFAIIRQLLEEWVDTLFVGFSATPWSRGLGRYWQKLIISATLQNMIDEGWAPPMRVFAPSKPDLTDVKIVNTAHGRDYEEGKVAEAMQKGSLTADIVSTWLQRGKGRPTLCFCVDRAHAMSLAQQFEKAGVGAAYQDGATSLYERDTIRERFHRGEIEVICSVATMIVGTDYDVRCIIWARPTKSEMFYVQGIGRGERPLFPPGFDANRATIGERKAAMKAAGKADLLILDHAGVTLDLGFATDIHHDKLDDGTPSKATSGSKPAQSKAPRECPSCTAVFPRYARVCPECGFEPKLQPREIETEAGELYELDGNKRNQRESWPEKISFIRGLRAYAIERGLKEGWVAHKYKARFGVWPNDARVRNAPPAADVDPFLRSWIKSQAIRYAKSREREKAA